MKYRNYWSFGEGACMLTCEYVTALNILPLDALSPRHARILVDLLLFASFVCVVTGIFLGERQRLPTQNGSVRFDCVHTSAGKAK